MAADRINPLEQIVQELTSLATASELPAVDELRDRVSGRRLRILVGGEAKRGKSTLINQLLSVNVLPVGVRPVTAIVTTVRRPPDESHHAVIAHFQDGRTEVHQLDDLVDLVTESKNPDNERNISHVEVFLHSGLLDDYDIELVDTPGTGSVFEHNTRTAHTAFDSLDAAIFVVSADPPISASERDLLHQIAGLSIHLFIVLNKSDQLDPVDLDDAKDFTATVCAEATGAPIPVFACSARQGTSDQGFTTFLAALSAYLTDHARDDVEIALSAHLTRQANTMRDTVLVTRRGIELAIAGSTNELAAFSDRLTTLTSSQRNMDDQAWAQERGLLRDLNESASRTTRHVSRECRDAANGALESSDFVNLSADDLETRLRTLVVQTIESAVDAWRVTEAKTLEAGLLTLRHHAVDNYQHVMDDVKDHARNLLNLDLALPVSDQVLQRGREFWYAFDRPMSFELPLAGTVRRLAPRQSERARNRVLDEIADLVDRQVGRARSDLQARLADTVRSLLAALRRDIATVAAALACALDDSRRVAASALPARSAKVAALNERVDRLTAIISQLAQPTVQ